MRLPQQQPFLMAGYFQTQDGPCVASPGSEAVGKSTKKEPKGPYSLYPNLGHAVRLKNSTGSVGLPTQAVV